MENPFGLNEEGLEIYGALSSAVKIQDFLDTLAINHEKDSETCMSPRSLLRTRKAHCFEAAAFAASVLWFHGHRPLLMEFRVARGDQDHAVALYRVNGYWGAISKTNHLSLRFRDPIYGTLRELAVSYFHEYFMTESGTKTLRSYTSPFSLEPYGTTWITSEKEIWNMAHDLHKTEHIPLIPEGNEKYIRKADTMERKGSTLIEWERKDPRT